MALSGFDTIDTLLLMLRERRISVAELISAYLERIAKYDNALNTIAELNQKVLEQAQEMDRFPPDSRKALSGIPLLVKDNIDVAGMHTTAGSAALTDNIASKDAPVVAALRRNGALILGKTNMTEFANYTSQEMPNGFSSHGGQVISAYDKKSDVSGSSTGSAVAVSAGLCPAAIGTDTSFSIVGCATKHGVAGYKPPHGTLPGDGIVPISYTLDSAGPIARNLRDAIFVYNAMRNRSLPHIEPCRTDTLRLAVNMHHQAEVSDRQHEKYEALLQELRSDGAHITEILHPHTPYQKEIMRHEFRHDLEEYLSCSNAGHKTLERIILFYETNPQYMPYGITYLRAAAEHVDKNAYHTALIEQQKLKALLTEELRGYDAVLMTGPTNIMHFVGFPSVALQLGMHETNKPCGMILYGANEERLLAAALTLEQYCDPISPPIMEEI